MYCNTSGNKNIALGLYALKSNTSGDSNIALGANTLKNNTTSVHNIALGQCSLYYNTTGNTNIAISRYSLYKNTTGCYNIALGPRALYCNTTGYNNIALGYGALRYARYNPGTGRDVRNNIAIGCEANQNLYGSSDNIAIGRKANCAATLGGGTVAIGNQALKSNTGDSNTAVGSLALYSLYTNNKNTAVGFRANFSITNVTQTIAVGSFAYTSNNNYHTVWGASTNNVYNCVWVAWTNVSDCRDKANIQPLSRNLGLPFIKKLNPVSFNWDTRQSYVDVCDFEYGEKDGTLVGERKEYGIIAQDVRKALDELEEQFDGLKYNAEKDAYRFTYEALIAPLIKSVQELSERLEAVEEKLK